jgi:prepilin-type processing-associated H-X9-DG protein
MKQIALAVHSYQDAEGRVPFGQFGDEFESGPDSWAWSWLARLLPYVEEGNLTREGRIPQITLLDSGVADRQIAIFLCPSDNSLTGPRTDAGNLEGFPVGLTNYKGVSGSNWGDDLEGLGGANFQTDWRHQGVNGSFDGLSDGDGMFFRVDYRRRLQLAGVGDGTSNTFMIGEDVPAKDRWCSWPYANNAYGTCAIPANVRKPDGTEYDPGDWRNTWSFRSRHPGGVQFATADGSVHFISDGISLEVYRALATINGGEAASVP